MVRKTKSKFRNAIAAVSALVAAVGGVFLLVSSAPAVEAYATIPEGKATPVGALSPDGTLTAVMRNDGAAEIRRTNGGLVGYVRGHGANLVHVAFTPDGQHIRTIDADGVMRLTEIAGLGIRETAVAHEPALRGWFADRLVRPALLPAAAAASGAEWAMNPLSPARQLDNPDVKAPLLPKGVEPPPGTMFRDCEDCPEMVVLPGGRFQMGSPESEEGRFENEGPQREVTIEAPIAVGRFEVTFGQYQRFSRETGHLVTGGCFAEFDGDVKWAEASEANWTLPGYAQDPDQPALCISWNDARAYVSWLSLETGQTYRLLSEAEWEYAARAGTTTPYSFGSNADRGCGYMNGADATAKQSNPDWTTVACDDGYLNTAPVGSFSANAFGLYDMHGNVWEWTEDCYAEDYSVQRSDGTAYTTPGCSDRVIRGGSWDYNPQFLRSANRNWYTPDYPYSTNGFRVARALPL